MSAKRLLATLQVTVLVCIGFPDAISADIAKTIAPVAISFTGASRYPVKQDHLKFLTLAALSSDLTYVTHDRCDVPGVVNNSFGDCDVHAAKGIRWSTRYKAYRFGSGAAAVTEWIIVKAPDHGVLFEGTSPKAQGDIISNPDDLAYLPATGFVGTDGFDYQVRTATGVSAPARVQLSVYKADEYRQELPLGVPYPGFGVADAPPADPVEWDEGKDKPGWFFIDQRSGQCTRDVRAFGNPKRPRCALPDRFSWKVAAGAKTVLRPGDYQLGPSGFETIEFFGTSQGRSWLVGVTDNVDRPVIRVNPARISPSTLRLYGGHFTIEGVDFRGVLIHHRLPDTDRSGNPVQAADAGFKVFRHNSVMDIALATNGSAVFLGGDPEQPSQGILIFDNKIARNGIMAPDLARERDVHGATVQGTQGYWFLENLCFENAGDCLQVNSMTTSDVYVGHLKCHSEGENCLDVKSFNGLVVSENDGWDLRKVFYGNSAGFSQVFYLNDEGQQRGEAWFLNNRAWDAAGPGVALANVAATAYVLGNQVMQSATGISLNGAAGKKYALLNSIVNSGVGIFVHSTTPGVDFVTLNVVANQSSNTLGVQQSSGGSIALLDYNAYVMPRFRGGAGSFRSPTIYSRFGSFRRATGHEKHGVYVRSNTKLHKVSTQFEQGISGKVPVQVLDRFQSVFQRPFSNRSNTTWDRINTGLERD